MLRVEAANPLLSDVEKDWEGILCPLYGDGPYY